jgi:hypothetical protein
MRKLGALIQQRLYRDPGHFVDLAQKMHRWVPISADYLADVRTLYAQLRGELRMAQVIPLNELLDI